VLERADTQLGTVQNSIKAAGVRTRAIERQLRGVESLSQDQARQLLGELGPDPGADAADPGADATGADDSRD